MGGKLLDITIKDDWGKSLTLNLWKTLLRVHKSLLNLFRVKKRGEFLKQWEIDDNYELNWQLKTYFYQQDMDS